MNETMMTQGDLRQIYAGIANFYTNIFEVSPKAAEALQKLQYHLEAGNQTMKTTRGGDEDEMGEPIPEGTIHEIELVGNSIITEEHLRDRGFDLTVNETVETMRSEIANGHIKPGTLPHMLTQYVINTMESFQRREFVGVKQNPEVDYYPGYQITGKVANYSFTPKIAGFAKKAKVDEFGKEVVDKKGKIQYDYRFPKGFANDSPVGASFEPRHDLIQGRGVYSAEQIDQAADRINFDGMNTTSFEYMKSLREVNNMLISQPPETFEQDQILRDHARAAATRMRQEIVAAMETDPKDPVALRFFGDIESQMRDTLSKDPAEGRALSSDLNAIDKYLSFLDTGLPLSSFAEYNEIHSALTLLEAESRNLDGLIEGMSELNKKAKEISEKLGQPSHSMDPKEIETWFRGIREGIEGCVDDYEKIKNNPVTKDDAIRERSDRIIDNESLRESYLRSLATKQNIPHGLVQSYIDKRMKAVEQDPAFQEYRKEALAKGFERNKKGYLEAVSRSASGLNVAHKKLTEKIVPMMYEDKENMGKMGVEKRRKYVTEMLGSMSDDMSSISKDLTEVAKGAGDLPKALDVAVKQAVTAGDPKLDVSPLAYMQAVEALKIQAERSGNQKILDFAKKNQAYFNNRTLEAQSKGILLDESLRTQRDVINRSGKDTLKQAIDAFNTRRSGIFGGIGTEFGAESPEHKKLREAATELHQMKQDLAEKQGLMHSDPKKWKELTGQMNNKAKEVSKLANAYLSQKGGSPRTSAGKARLNGAREILREAQLVPVELKRREAAAASYEKLGKDTGKIRAASEKRAQELKERSQRIEREKAQEQIKAQERKEKNEQYKREHPIEATRQELEAARKEAEKAPRGKEGPGQRRPTNIDHLAEKFGMKEDMKKTEKKAKSHAAQKQAVKGKEQENPEMGGEN